MQETRSEGGSGERRGAGTRRAAGQCGAFGAVVVRWMAGRVVRAVVDADARGGAVEAGASVAGVAVVPVDASAFHPCRAAFGALVVLLARTTAHNVALDGRGGR